MRLYAIALCAYNTRTGQMEMRAAACAGDSEWEVRAWAHEQCRANYSGRHYTSHAVSLMAVPSVLIREVAV